MRLEDEISIPFMEARQGIFHNLHSAERSMVDSDRNDDLHSNGSQVMPKFLEDKLKAEYGANSKVPYKVMNKIGAMKGNKETAKGREMQAKHEKQMRGESHEYDHRRPKRPVKSRYNGAAGAAY